MSACSSGNHDEVSIRASLADTSTDPLQFYAKQSPTTDPGEYAYLLEGLPADAAGIVRTVQGVLVRVDANEKAGFPIPRRRADRELGIGTVRGVLERIAELDGRPLAEPREYRNHVVSICAQYAMLTTALFRHRGIPARARGGFETYFSETRHHDHWITEYWNAEAGRWVRVDAEIESEEGLDLPDGAFLTGAEAWRMCRNGKKPPGHFGIWGGEWIGGWDFVLNELVLDFDSLNKVESLPWDEVGLTQKGYTNLTESELELLDSTAEAALEDDVAFGRIRELFRSRPELRKRH
jgi:hypothetical protein